MGGPAVGRVESQTMPGTPHCLRVCVFVGLSLAFFLMGGRDATAQQSGVELQPIRPSALGLGGLVRRGTWTPVRLDLFNESVEVRGVVCRWLLTDDDGDQVIAERAVDLTPQREQQVWLYANPPLNIAGTAEWVFQIVDADSDQLLAQQTAKTNSGAYLSPTVGVVGVCGVEDMGLLPYSRWASTHEQTVVALGLNLETLPDRWYGLSLVSTLVWGPNDSGDPNGNAVSEPTQQALREWVYRGGHLVIVLESVGQTWTASPLADLLGPLDASYLEQIESAPPIDGFGSLKELVPMPMTAFDPPDDSGYTPLLTVPISDGDDASAPPVNRTVAMSRRYGFGQVTLVGFNLTDNALFNSVRGADLHRIWTNLLGWRAGKEGRLLTSDELREQANELYESGKFSNKYPLGDWVDTRVAKQTTAGPAIGLAVILFIIYWAVGLSSFPAVLRTKGWDRFSWLVFLGVIALFSALAWGGAALLRPAKTSATHFTVLDIDGNTGHVHARSWVSLFIPRFDDIRVSVPSDGGGVLPGDLTNLVSSPGVGMSAEGAGYVDTQSYTFDTTRPDTVAVPIRATTKPLVIDFLGQISVSREGLDEPWKLPRASNLSVSDSGLPIGSVTHQFEGDLSDVLIIFCPGGSGRPGDDKWKPIVWRYTDANGGSAWKPGVPMPMPTSTTGSARLWSYPDTNQVQRFWNREGFLGQQVAARRFTQGNGSDNNLVYDISLLSFYDAVPPPLIQRAGASGWGSSDEFALYQRTILRDIDMTALTTGRRLIIIGHLRDSRIPVPLSVEGGQVPTEGWTVVRWIYDF